MPDKHAFLSPSSSERWYHCPPSSWLCEQFPDLGSVFAAEGTEAHRLCEFLLHEMLGIPDVDPRPGMTYYTREMEECCQGYAQFIRERLEAWKAKGVKPEVFIEQRVDLRNYIPESMGTSDCVIVAEDEIGIIDFKYGMHRVPASSLQLRIYALGACELFRNLYDFSRVRMTISQKNLWQPLPVTRGFLFPLCFLFHCPLDGKRFMIREDHRRHPFFRFPAEPVSYSGTREAGNLSARHR